MTTQPTIQEYLDAANDVYGQNPTVVPETGWKVLLQSSTSELSDGFYAIAYEDVHGNILIAYDGTQPGLTTYGVGTLAADGLLAANITPQALNDAVNFSSLVSSLAQSRSVYVTGHSLGGTEAEAATAGNASIAGGETFAATGLPGYSGFSSKLTDFVDAGDFIANFANDGTNAVESLYPVTHYHVGIVEPVGTSHSGTITAAEIALLLADSPLGDELFAYLLNQSLNYHALSNYYADLQAIFPSLKDPSQDNVSVTIDSVGASLIDHGTIQVGAAPISEKIDSVDKSYASETGSAGTIITTGALSGTPVDKDWYSFSTTVGATYTITATTQGISSGEVALSIKNSVGNTVDVNQIGNSSDDVADSPSGISTITFTATGTQYYTAVSAGGPEGVWEFATGNYSIGISQSTSSTAISINDVTVNEGNSGTKVETFTVTRSGGESAFDVNYKTVDGSATAADGDYVPTSGTLHFAANVNTQTIQVTINGDTKVEADETFSVLLSGATNGATIADNQGIGTIANDDTGHAPTVTIATTGGVTASAVQTISGTVDVADASKTITVFDGANVVGSAIAAANGSWTTNVTLSVQGANTLVAKATNSVGTGVSNSVFYTLGTASYNLTPSNPSATENQGSLVFTLTRTNETDASTVFVQTDETHGSPNPNNEYFNEQNLIPVFFPQYATSATFSIAINDIHATSGTQTFGVSIYPSLSTSGTPLATTTLTIHDTDTNTGPLTGNIITNDTVTGTTTISSPVGIFNSATLQNNGVIDINNGGSINGDNAGGILFNPAGSVININTADTSSSVIDITRVNNAGTIIVSPGSGNVATIWATNGGINDTGAMQVLSGTLQLHMFGAGSTANLNASGISVAASANLLFTGAGTFTISGGTYNVAGTTIVGNSTYAADVIFAAGTVVNVGENWSIQDGSVDFSAATLSGSFSSLTLGASATNLKFGTNSVAINNFSSFLVNVTDSGTITLTGPDVTDAAWRGGGTVINEGTISAPPDWQDGEITNGETFINHGITNNLLFEAGSFVTNASDGVMNIQSAEAIGAAITNNGLIKFFGLGSGFAQINSSLDNAGTVEFSAASGWTLNNGGTSNASNLTIDTGVTLFVGGNAAADTFTITGGTFDSGDFWVLSGAKAKFAASTQVNISFHNDGTIEVAGGTLTLEQPLTGTGIVQMDAGTTLALDAPQGFTNSISGFSSGDSIDLIGTTATGVSINTNNQLVVTDAGTTVATLQMVGNYPGTGLQFLLTPDGTGGTKIALGVPVAPIVNAGTIATFVDSISPSPVTLDETLSVIGGGNPTLTGAVVSVSSGFQSGDVLAATTTGTAIAASYNALTGALTLSGHDTLANYQSVLRSVTFDSTVNAQVNGTDPSRTISWTVNDGTHTSVLVTSTVNIADAAPTMPAPAPSTFTVNGSPAPIVLDATFAISDIDNNTLTGATVSIASGFGSGDVLGVSTTGTAITVTSNTGGVLKLAGADTLADYQAVLRTVTFATSDTTVGGRIIVWTASDGRHESTSASIVNISVPTTAIESFGSTTLTQVGNNFFLYANSTATGPELKYGGTPWTTGQWGGWAPIGVEATATGYEVAFKLSAGAYTVWNTDANGNITANPIGTVSGSSLTLEALETSFHQDLNGDGAIGLPPTDTLIEVLGSTSLLQTGSNYVFDKAGGGAELHYDGAAFVAGQWGGWTPIGVEATATGYEVAFKVAGADLFTVWDTDASGNIIIDPTGTVSGESPTLIALEKSFQQDLNGDGMIGNPAIPIAVESFGSTSLVLSGNDYFLDANGTSNGPMLKIDGAAWTDGHWGSWTPIGVEATASGYEVAFNLVGTNQYTVWNTDANGNITTDTIGTVTGNSAALEGLETSFHQDLNGDGIIGDPSIPFAIETSGSTSLTQLGHDFFLYAHGTSNGPELKDSGAPWTIGHWGGWTPIAAEATAGGYEVAFKLTGADLYTVWNTDSNGNITTNPISSVAGSDSSLQSIETSFHQDLNGDGVIGPPSHTSPASLSITASGSGNAIVSETAASDTFMFNAHFGNSTVAGFQPAADHDNIGHTLFAGVADLISHVADNIGGAANGAEHSLAFDSVSKLLLQHAGDFHLV